MEDTVITLKNSILVSNLSQSFDKRITLKIKKHKGFNHYNYKYNIIKIFVLIIMLFKSTSSINNTIILNFKDKGNQALLNSNFQFPPSFILLNNVNVVVSKYILYINSLNDNVSLIWNYEFNSMSQMFTGLANITKIDFTNFNFEPIKTMVNMFANCINLKDVNFGNYSTKNIESTENLFLGCSSLELLDLSNFDTSKVTTMKNMFYECIKLKKIIFSEFKNSATQNMYGLFCNCYSLVSIDLSHFFTPNCLIMWNMFQGDISLKTLNLTTFDTSKVTDMESMFDGCGSLISLDISNFQTSNVIYMNKMFRNCTSLEYLDFSSINTNSINRMEQMFYQCKSLKYLNLFNLNKEQSTTDMFTKAQTGFFYCINSFSNIPNIQLFLNGLSAMNNCHHKCFSGYRYSYNEKKCCDNYLHNLNCVSSCPIRTYLSDRICQDLNCINYYSYSQKECIDNIPEGYFLNNTLLKTIDKCHSDCKTCDKLYTQNNSNCNMCKGDKYFYLGNCYDVCPKGSYFDEIKKCKCFEEKCFTCSEESLKHNLCITCNEDYYPKLNDSSNIDSYINCYKSIKGYYLEDNYFKKCYESCLTCEEKGEKQNHNCNICKAEYSFEMMLNSKKNCYKECPFYYYIDIDKNITYCTINDKCTKEFDKLILEKKKCVKNCSEDEKYKYEFRKQCFEKCPANTEPSKIKEFYCEIICNEDKPFERIKLQECVENCDINEMQLNLCVTKYISNETNSENKIKDKIIDKKFESIENSLTSDNYNTSNLDNGKTEVIKDEKFTITLTTTENQKSTKNTNMTTIDLGPCEKLLKDYYKMKDDELLYMKQIEVYQEGLNIPIIQYDVYAKLNRDNLVKLNLTVCQKEKVDISIKVEISDDIDKLNISSPYYNDICYIDENNDGVDISIKDRKTDYVENNKAVCQEDCLFTEYDYDNQKAKCSCSIKETPKSFSEMNINKTKLYENFVDFKNIVNLNILICYRELFSRKGVLYNIGCYIIIPIIIFYFICLIIFYKRDKFIIKKSIKKIKFALKHYKYTKMKSRRSSKNTIKDNDDKRIKTNYERKNINNLITQKEGNIINSDNDSNNKIMIGGSISRYIQKKFLKKKKSKKDQLDSPPNENLNNKGFDNKINNINNSFDKNQTKNNKTKMNKLEIKELKKKVINILKLNDTELNNLSYSKALKLDERKCFQFYFSLLKTKHIFFFSFLLNNDYNSKVIKIFLFFFNFTIYYFVNALFFDDKTMHKIYEDGGSFNFVYQIPQILYSSIVSTAINSLIKILAISENKILEFKKRKHNSNIDQKKKQLEKYLHYKFIIFFIITFIFTIFFWYYLACFCAIYRNTQIHLIKDTIISFGLSLLYPFGFCLFPCIFRIPSLSAKNKNRKYFYKTSLLIQKVI